MKSFFVISLIFLNLASALPQRINVGLGFDVGLTTKTKFSSDWIFPEYSYNLYLISQENNTKHSFSNFSFSPSVMLDYKHVFVKTEFKYTIWNADYQLLSPVSDLISIFSENELLIVNTKEQFFTFPLLIGYKFIPRKITPFISGGAAYNINIKSLESYDHLKSALANTYYAGGLELYSYTYNYENFISPLLEIGMVFSQKYISLRYGWRAYDKESKLKTDISYFQLSFSSNITFDKIRKKNYLTNE